MIRLPIPDQRRFSPFSRAHHDAATPRCDNAFSLTPMSSSFVHKAVLMEEVLSFLRPAAGRTILDGTLGGGGHAGMLLAGGARVIGFDRDPEALAHVRQSLAGHGPLFTAVEGSFENAPGHLADLGISRLDGILLDLGVSSHQLDTAARGFSFQAEGPLDMRMGKSGATAGDLVNTASLERLATIFRDCGEEPRARLYASRIVRSRQAKPIDTTLELARLIAAGRGGPRHPATRVFQALRIAVNDEMGALERALPKLSALLSPGGRLAVITFHSLEDRLVKQFFRRHSLAEVDDPTWPAPRPNPERLFDNLTPRSVTASEDELRLNPRSRSARLRAVERRGAPQPGTLL